jgi:CHAD domain-containing protein
MSNHRKRYRAQWDGAELEISLDSVRILDSRGNCTGSFRELEIESVRGSVDALGRLVGELRRSMPLRTSRLGKFERALWLSGRNLALDRAWRSTTPAGELLKVHLLHDLRVISQSREIALEGDDPEGIHRLRTHVRRLRATLAGCGNPRASAAAAFSRRFKALADAVADMRDHDVYAVATMKLLGSLPGVREKTVQQFEALLESERKRIGDEGFRVLSHPDMSDLLRDFQSWIETAFDSSCGSNRADRHAPVGVRGRDPNIGELAAKELAHRSRNVRKSIQKLLADDGNNPGDAALHTLRIRIKKLRYVLELFQPLFGCRTESLTAVLRRLQDRLGDHQDARVAVIRGQQLAASVPLLPQNRDVLITFGRLQRGRECVVAAVRDGFLTRKGRKRLARELKAALKSL